MSELPAWVSEPALLPVWRAVHQRLERNRLEPRGTVTVRGLDRPSRHAVSGLLGRPMTSDVVRIDLAQLDAELRERTGRGAVGVVTRVVGPLTDRARARSERERARALPFDAVRAWLDEYPDGVRESTEPWLTDVRTSGVLTRAASPEAAARALVQAADIARVVTRPSAAPVARTELAARHTGDAHALDDGALCGALVLRALALALERPAPRTAAERRELWHAAGVPSDRVSTTVLTLGLRALGDDPLAQRLRLAAAQGDPVHVTAWDLDHTELRFSAEPAVLVCENPRVLEAAAATHGGECSVICTSGMPGTVAMRLLEHVRACGIELRYHGDFDWPGIAIANRLVSTAGCVPWHMAAADYLVGVRADGPPLTGRPVPPMWDEALGQAMSERSVAVHEEALLERLLPQMLELAGRQSGRTALRHSAAALP